MQPRRSTDLRRDDENPAPEPDATSAENSRRAFFQTVVRGAVAAALALLPTTRKVAAQRPPPDKAFPHVEDPEQGEVLARKRIDEYLHKNAERAEELDDMSDTIEQFRGLAPNIVVIKCMDERLQGPLGKGCPETIIVYLRSDGSRIEVRADNDDLNLLINQAIAQEKARGHAMPVIVLVVGHTECAAHKHHQEPISNTNERTLRTVRDEVQDLNDRADNNGTAQQLCHMAAMTDTENLGMTLYEPNGESPFLDVQKVISDAHMTQPPQIFNTDFLEHTIGNEAHPCIRGKTIGSLFAGENPSAFNDHRVTIAIETYLLQKITTAVQQGTLDKSSILSTHVQQNIHNGLPKDFPDSLRGFMTYMLAWNTAHAIYRNQYLARLQAKDPSAYENATKHAGIIVCHGRGFDTNKSQDGLVVRPSTREDNRAMGTARNVMADVYTRLHPGHFPIVHINIELDHPLETGQQLAEVQGRMKNKIDVVAEAFGADVHILTTYSYHHSMRDQLIDNASGRKTLTKQYLPLNPDTTDKRIICPDSLLGKDITPITIGKKVEEMRKRESDYSSQSLLKKAE